MSKDFDKNALVRLRSRLERRRASAEKIVSELTRNGAHGTLTDEEESRRYMAMGLEYAFNIALELIDEEEELNVEAEVGQSEAKQIRSSIEHYASKHGVKLLPLEDILEIINEKVGQ